MNFLITTFTFAVTSSDVSNIARVNIFCEAMDFTCAGAGYLSVSNVGAGNPGIVYGSTTWLITNWGTNDGTFNFTTPTGGLGTVSSYPMNGSISDIVIEAQTGFNDGWSHTNITNISTNKWKLDAPQCSATGSLTYHFILTAKPNAVAGTYVITFIQSFVAD
jgi:hypothetical protein